MPQFAYKGRNARGELVNGALEGLDTGAIADQLFRTGITPLEIRASRERRSRPREAGFRKLFEERVKVADVLLFSRHMYSLLRAGVPILRALGGLQESNQNKAFGAVLRDIRERLDTGRELSTSLREHPKVFNNFYVSMIRVGEMTGRLDEIFLRLFHHLEFEKHTRDQIKAAMRYPSFVLAALAVAMMIVNIFVIPAFAKVYAGFKAELPLMTRILVHTSDFTVKYWPMLLLGTVAAVLAFRSYTKAGAGKYRWDKWKLSFPIVGSIIEKATLARFARSMSLAIKSGVPIVQSLSVVALVVDNDYIAHRIEQMRDGVERGETVLRVAVTAGVFTPVVLQMVAVGEETGAMDDLLDEIANMYDREVEYEVKNLSSKIEPLLIVAMGALALVLALGIFLPIWDLGRVAIKQ